MSGHISISQIKYFLIEDLHARGTHSFAFCEIRTLSRLLSLRRHTFVNKYFKEHAGACILGPANLSLPIYLLFAHLIVGELVETDRQRVEGNEMEARTHSLASATIKLPNNTFSAGPFIL